MGGWTISWVAQAAEYNIFVTVGANLISPKSGHICIWAWRHTVYVCGSKGQRSRSQQVEAWLLTAACRLSSSCLIVCCNLAVGGGQLCWAFACSDSLPGFSTRCIHRTNHCAIAMVFVYPFVHLSLRLSGTGVHCDHMMHFSADLSSWLDSPTFWAACHQSMSTYSQPSFSSSTWNRGGVWMCKLGEELNANNDK